MQLNKIIRILNQQELDATSDNSEDAEIIMELKNAFIELVNQVNRLDNEVNALKSKNEKKSP